MHVVQVKLLFNLSIHLSTVRLYILLYIERYLEFEFEFFMRFLWARFSVPSSETFYSQKMRVQRFIVLFCFVFLCLLLSQGFLRQTKSSLKQIWQIIATQLFRCIWYESLRVLLIVFAMVSLKKKTDNFRMKFIKIYIFWLFYQCSHRRSL